MTRDRHPRFVTLQPRLLRAIAAGLCVTLPVTLASSADAKPQRGHKIHGHAPAKPKAARAKIAHRPVAKAARVRLTAKLPADVLDTADVKPAPPVKQLSREEILSSNTDRLERLGRHVMVGFQSFSEVELLVKKRAIAGIFITTHNVHGQRAADIKASIDKLQALRKDQGLPPLVIAADQEGGNVSRLSPPLKRQPTLALTIAKLTHDDDRQKAVTAYAEIQAEELKRIGVTLNFAPVVDLKLNAADRDDGETRIRMRAIADDPYLVSKVGTWYCDALAKAGILCTLKHFPGLGRVLRDTHVASGEISETEGKLELNDWVPFRRLMQMPNAATMLGHVRVGAIDKNVPASYSQTVIAGLIRDRWQYDGLLITDDFCMGAITGSKSGIGGAAVKSLNAGTDVILVSFAGSHYDDVMSALIAADETGALDARVRDASRARLTRILDPSSWNRAE